jgi:bifunctional DNA-binding transcriptional regulator/antitoxin component of YhaV-PrlF toxin-antitoxin module
MPLTRKTIFSSNSIVVTIPSQLVKAYDISAGDMLEFIPLEEEIRIKKAKVLKS